MRIDRKIKSPARRYRPHASTWGSSVVVRIGLAIIASGTLDYRSRLLVRERYNTNFAYSCLILISFPF